MAGLLALGFICNLLVKPVAEKNVMTPQEIRSGWSAPWARRITIALPIAKPFASLLMTGSSPLPNRI